MRSLILVLMTCILLTGAGFGQVRTASIGASKFTRNLGGLSSLEAKTNVIQRIAGDGFDEIEAGGGLYDWTEVNGRIFLTRRWMVEIGKIKQGYSTFDFKKQLAGSIQKQLASEGFKIKPSKYNLGPLRYQRGTTVGTLDVLTFWLGSGNPPLRMEFIFHKSYQRKSVRK